MKLSTLAATRTVKALAIGYPKTGKTGSLASLANAGYKIGILDFDRNIDPLMEFVDPVHQDNVSVISFEEQLAPKKFTRGKLTIEKLVPIGTPEAFAKSLRVLNNWKDEETDWGPVKEWGPDHIIVLDSLTSMGEAAMWRILHMNNRLGGGPRKNDWGSAQNEQAGLIEMLKVLKCHVIVMAHLKLIEPRFLDDLTDDSTMEDVASEVRKAMEAATGLVPTRLWPSALGKALPQNIGKSFPFILRYQTKMMGQVAKRKIVLTPSEECDAGVPLKMAEKELDIEDGLLRIFEEVRKDG